MDRRLGGALLALAALLLCVGVVLWQHAGTEAEKDGLAAEYGQVISGQRMDTHPEPDRTPAYATFALAALATICGTIILSRGNTHAPEAPHPQVPHDRMPPPDPQR